MDWTAGYDPKIDYLYGYYRELAPGHIDFALALSGHAPPDRTHMRYLELGFGQGLSVNIHAAAVAGEFWGADFNPAHAANARGLAAEAGSGARLYDDSFDELLARPDLPEFDYVVLHGVWSWVSDENRRTLLEILRRTLKVGGAVYVSYNVLPGWSTIMPLRQIMAMHTENAGSQEQGASGRIDAAIAFAGALAETGARYFTVNPTAKSRLDGMGGQSRSYLAHELFVDGLRPMYAAEAHDWLSQAKLSYACAAAVLDQLDSYNLTAAQQTMIASLTTTAMRETVRDFMLNQFFRRDLLTRGARRLSLLERHEVISGMRVALVAPAEDCAAEVETIMGKVAPRRAIYEPVIAALAENGGGPKRIGDLARHKALATLPRGALVEALSVLIGAGRAHPAQSEAAIEAAAPTCARLNAAIMARARLSGEVYALASPVIGAGVPVGRFDQLFLAARRRGLTTPTEWAMDVWRTLASQGQGVLKDGETLQGEDDNLRELRDQANAFSHSRLAPLQTLGIAD